MRSICIVLAVFLVTSVFSMAEMWIRAEQTAMINKHGNLGNLTSVLTDIAHIWAGLHLGQSVI